jgi:glycosyltransferase involved in cell wall biosynthesis
MSSSVPNQPQIAVVIPCYRVLAQISSVIVTIPPEVRWIILVDDACPEESGRIARSRSNDTRLELVVHQEPQGVGGAMVSGFRRALELGAEIVVKIDGDGQMNPALLHRFVAPIASGRADYTKGNRFYRLESLRSMPGGVYLATQYSPSS